MLKANLTFGGGTQPDGDRYHSVWSLILTNIVTIGVALVYQWDLRVLIWGYWFQGVIFGIFNFLNIILLESFDTEHVEINGRPFAEKSAAKLFIGVFFLCHYGFFHFVYLIFLMMGFSIGIKGFMQVLFAALLFFVNSLFTFWKQRPIYRHNQNIGVLMFFPYARIVPLHMIILLGFSSAQWASALAVFNPLLILFLVLKTVADAVTHLIEISIFKRAKAAGEAAVLDA